ncbi:MAG: glycosyltransferase [Acidimicrobiales bacterium]
MAGAGGHLEELWMLRPRLVGVPGEVTWVTADTPQSRSLLRGERLIFIPKSKPRDAWATAATAGRAFEVLRQGNWSAVVSTGSLPAVPFLTLARARGIPCHFIESAARVDAPSLSARILECIPGVHRYGQYRWWARDRWRFRGSVFDGFRTVGTPGRPIRRVVVTIGSSRYGFRRLVEAVRRALPEDVEVLWQTGSTDVSGLGIDAVATLPAAELFDAMSRADLVVAHAGVGSAVMALRAGKCPVLLPRRRRDGEHADDHQRQLVRVLGGALLAVAADPGSLSYEHLVRAAGRSAVEEDVAPFLLEAG